MKKKNRVIGTQEFYNSSTGEIVEMQIMETDAYEKDINFHKLFLKNFINALEPIANQKLSLCFWILSNLSKDNLLLYTYRQIADKTGVSYKTVADTMKYLQGADFVRKHGSGYYMVNPDIIYKGSYQRRCIAMGNYCQIPLDHTTNSDEIRLQDLQNSISRLQRKEKSIQNRLDLENFLHADSDQTEHP